MTTCTVGTGWFVLYDDCMPVAGPFATEAEAHAWEPKPPPTASTADAWWASLTPIERLIERGLMAEYEVERRGAEEKG